MQLSSKLKVATATVMVTAIWVGAVAVIITDGAEAEDTGTITIKTLSSVALKGPPAKAAPFFRLRNYRTRFFKF
jgi:hypothetical protein